MSLIGAGNVRIRAQDWNKAVSDCGRLVPKAGRGIMVDRRPDGSAVSADPLFGWRHPWNVVPRWIDGAWRLNIQPGFVNGDPVLMVGTAFTKRTFVETQVKRPVVVTIGDTTREVTETVTEFIETFNEKDLELTEVPWWKVAGTRNVIEDVPAFFVSKGVASQAQAAGAVTTANFDRINLSELAAQAPGERVLRSVDIVAVIYRPQLRSTFEVVDASAATGTILEYVPSYDFTSVTANGTQARLVQEAPYVPQKTPDILLRALGVEPDTDQDKIHLATVYFLGPDAKTLELDERWTPYVKHHVFWNLMHSPKNVIPELGKIPRRPPFFTGLAGGFGDMIVNQFSALQGVIENEVLNFYRQDESGGAFWST